MGGGLFPSGLAVFKSSIHVGAGHTVTLPKVSILE